MRNWVRVVSLAAICFASYHWVPGQGEPWGEEKGGGDAKPDSKYVGSGKCKNCHAAATNGDSYGKWTKSKHAKAYETLASEQAKKIAKEKNIEDPQKSAECLKCHVTGHDAPAALKDKKFDPALGVQCESCHGPGGKHVKARLAAETEEKADKPIELPKGEWAAMPGAENCKTCHNEKSPTFKPFVYKERAKEIDHLDPRKKRPADYFEKLP